MGLLEEAGTTPPNTSANEMRVGEIRNWNSGLWQHYPPPGDVRYPPSLASLLTVEFWRVGGGKTGTRCGQKREPSAQNRALRGDGGCPPSPGLCSDAVTYFTCGINIVFLKTEPFIQVYYQVLGASPI